MLRKLAILELKRTIRYAIDGIFMNIFKIFRGKRSKSIILVRTDHVGDFFIWLSTVEHYRVLYPNYKITLITNIHTQELACKLPYWDSVIGIDTTKFSFCKKYRLTQIHRICHINAEIAIQPVISRATDIGDSIIRATCAQIRIGSEGTLLNTSEQLKKIGDNWYSRLIKFNDEISEIQNNFSFINNINAKLDFPIKPYHTPKLLDVQYLNLPNNYVVIFPGANWSGRQWPAEKFAEVINFLIANYSAQIVICGSANESTIGQIIENHTSSDQIKNLIGKTSLIETIEIIRNSLLLIGNDTSGIHIAATVATHSICIIGGGHPDRFAPYPFNDYSFNPITIRNPMPCYNCNWICNHPQYTGEGAVPCVSQISVKQVTNACRHLLR